MVVAKRQRKEKPAKIEQRQVRGPECRPEVTQTALLVSPIYIGQGQGKKKIHKKRSQKLSWGGGGVGWGEVGGWRWGDGSLLFASFGSASLTPQGCIFLCLPIKLSYNTGPSIPSNFCCGETEPRKLETSPTELNPSELIYQLKLWLDYSFLNSLTLVLIVGSLDILEFNVSSKKGTFKRVIHKRKMSLASAQNVKKKKPLGKSMPF